MLNNITKIKSIRTAVCFLFIGIAAVVYYNFDPELNKLFTPCLFKAITGYKCPGCGTQRAIYHLLHFDVVNAFFKNPMLVLVLPYLVLGLMFEYTKLGVRSPRVRKVLLGRVVVCISFILVITYWVTRNIFNF